MNSNNFLDDGVFPTTHAGMLNAGLIVESAGNTEGTEQGLTCESASDSSAASSAKSQAMSAVVAWIDGDDFTYKALDEFVIGVCDLDGDFEIGESEEDLYNDAWKQIPNAIASLGFSSEESIDKFVNAESDDEGAKIGKILRENLDEFEADDDEIIAGFAFGEQAVFESAEGEALMVLEAAFKKKKVVRDGKVQIVRKRVSGKARMSAAQRAGLKKARRKAHSAAGKVARKKSMKIRKNRGI